MWILSFIALVISDIEYFFMYVLDVSERQEIHMILRETRESYCIVSYIFGDRA